MIIAKYNKKYSGQVLLIVVMLIATVLTVFLSTSFKSNMETQLTKLEEENQKALAAAQAGLEAALKRNAQVSIGSLSQDFSGFSGSAIIEQQISKEFITPLLNKDEQYTFYLASYDPQAKNFSGGSTSQNINICFNNQDSSQAAIEITLIKSEGSNYSIKRYAYNPQSNNNIINNALSADPPNNSCPEPEGESFNDFVTINSADVGINSQLLIVRVIGSSSKIGFKANDNFPLQGKSIISTAKSPAGAEKKIYLFQSYPQIPSDFFVTSF